MEKFLVKVNEICEVDFVCDCCGEHNNFKFTYQISYFLPKSKIIYDIELLQKKMNKINNTNSKSVLNQTWCN